MNSNKAKKIVSIVIISVVLAITILTVVLALIPKKLYNPIANGYDYITVYKKDASVNNYADEDSDEQKAIIDNIAKYLEKSTKDNVLSSIFQGTGKVANDRDFQERTVYVVDGEGNSDYQIKFIAHQSDLYTYIESLQW